MDAVGTRKQAEVSRDQRGYTLDSRVSAVTDEPPEAKPEVAHADVVVVGGGPAGVVLALLLARKGVRVTLLEAQGDFAREFRGDTLHPATMELMDQIGLAERLLEIEHVKAREFSLHTPRGTFTVGDYGRLQRTRFPYLVLMPQARFLEFLVAEAKQYPNFKIGMRSRVVGLIEEDGRVRGVRYRNADGERREIRTELVVGTDGRFSKVRQLAGIELDKFGVGQDMLWFKLPRRPKDPSDADAGLYFGPGHYLALLKREEHWQAGYSIPKDGYKEAREAGVEPIKTFIRENAPSWLHDRLDELRNWEDIRLLSVQIARVKRWYGPGLLLIGDAAHVTSPAGGIGISLAIQDAVAAANKLAEPLQAGRLSTKDLAAVQRRRGWQILLDQRMQVSGEKGFVKVLDNGGTWEPSLAARLALRIPVLRDLPVRLNAFGFRTERLKPELVEPSPSPTGSRAARKLGLRNDGR